MTRTWDTRIVEIEQVKVKFMITTYICISHRSRYSSRYIPIPETPLFNKLLTNYEYNPPKIKLKIMKRSAMTIQL